MILRTMYCLVAFVVAYEAVPQAPEADVLGFTVFGVIVGAIVGLAKIVEVLVTKRNGRNGAAEVKRLADCIVKVEAALTANTAILALIQQRQEFAHERMKEVSGEIAKGLTRIERKIA